MLLSVGIFFARSGGLKENHEKPIRCNGNHAQGATRRTDDEHHFQQLDGGYNDGIQSVRNISWNSSAMKLSNSLVVEAHGDGDCKNLY
jgi:hypothetical protein